MSSNTDNINEDSGRSAHLVQVREVLEGALQGHFLRQELLGSSLLRLNSTPHGEGARKSSYSKPAANKYSQGRGADTVRVRRAPAVAEEMCCVF